MYKLAKGEFIAYDNQIVSFHLNTPCNDRFISKAWIQTADLTVTSLLDNLWFKTSDLNSWRIYLTPDLQDYLRKTTKPSIYCICSFQKHDFGDRVVVKRYLNKIKGVRNHA